MPKIEYVSKVFRADRLELINKINDVIADYSVQGFNLTLRQVYYQMVARAIIPNNERSYKNLGNLISDARLAGLVDWNAIEDRTRYLRGNSHWLTPGSMIDSAAYSYHLDHWKGQRIMLRYGWKRMPSSALSARYAASSTSTSSPAADM